jgi:galactose mutarotase-like enzyme
MNATIQNTGYRAVIDSLGAEMKSLRDAKTGREYLWQADPAWWKGTAPVLFPIVGGLKNGRYRYEGREYELPQHGFARASEFRQNAVSADAVEFVLGSSAETLPKYPFDFQLRVGYALERCGIAVRYTVTNAGNRPMLFSIGSHPAFNIPFDVGSLENHYILFEHPEDSERYFFKDGTYIAGKTAEVFESSRVISLSRTLFDQGPLIMKGLHSAEFTLMSAKSTRAVKVAMDSAPPFLGIWSKPGAPFVCIEPWDGIPDSTEASGELAEKEGILKLEPGSAYRTGYRIEILG